LNADKVDMGHLIDKAEDNVLKQTLSFGIGMHHAGLMVKDRKIVE
jgi:replicative superfamily II helicase